jgi:hypothetical protein
LVNQIARQHLVYQDTASLLAIARNAVLASSAQVEQQHALHVLSLVTQLL